MPAVAKRWHLLPHDADAIARMARQLHVPPVVAQLLLNRGFTEPASAQNFLTASLGGLHPPELLPGVPEAARRLADAVRTSRRVVVFGDYDVDGLTGTAILWRLLRRLGVTTTYYVPNRLEEGYGLNSSALRQIAEEGPALVVTVDCGITSVGPALEARRLGLELIVTDHHEPKEELPAADVLVHPRLPGSQYPFGGLSGAGVAFKLAWAICQELSSGPRVKSELRAFLVEATALAALGLVADVVPLQDENRVFVRHGLARLTETPAVGLKALLASAGLAEKAVRAEDVAFRVAPRLNAAGRLGCARAVVELLTTNSPQRAQELAEFLETQNRQRQDLERRISQQARDLVESDANYASAAALVLADPSWHSGVIGIVAGRLAEQYARPVLMIAAGGEAAPGSGRSVPGFALHEALAACGEDLLSHGGHAAAAGFRIHPGRIDTFRERFCRYTAAHFPDGPPPPRLVLDAEVPLSALTFGLLKDLDRLEPYGANNPRPKFLAGDLEIVGGPRRIGLGERHLNFRVRQGSTTLRVIAWSMGERLEELLSVPERRCCLAFTPRINEWNGSRTVEMEAIDFQPGPVAQLA